MSKVQDAHEGHVSSAPCLLASFRLAPGHADPSITAVYDHYSYEKEKRKALRKWCCELRSILAGEEKPETVVKLPFTASSPQTSLTADDSE